MNEFERRWQACAAEARQAPGVPVAAPAGLATRTWARYLARSGVPALDAWAALSFRALVLATIALLICAAIEFCTPSQGSPLTLHLEDVVTSIWQTR